jgi:hypothetical protein
MRILCAEIFLFLAQGRSLLIRARGGGFCRLPDYVGIGLFLIWSMCKMTHEGYEGLSF